MCVRGGSSARIKMCAGFQLPDDRLRVGRGATRAEDAQETPTQIHISPSVLVYEDRECVTRLEIMVCRVQIQNKIARKRVAHGGDTIPLKCVTRLRVVSWRVQLQDKYGCCTGRETTRRYRVTRLGSMVRSVKLQDKVGRVQLHSRASLALGFHLGRSHHLSICMLPQAYVSCLKGILTLILSF